MGLIHKSSDQYITLFKVTQCFCLLFLFLFNFLFTWSIDQEVQLFPSLKHCALPYGASASLKTNFPKCVAFRRSQGSLESEYQLQLGNNWMRSSFKEWQHFPNLKKKNEREREILVLISPHNARYLIVTIMPDFASENKVEYLWFLPSLLACHWLKSCCIEY